MKQATTKQMETVSILSKTSESTTLESEKQSKPDVVPLESKPEEFEVEHLNASHLFREKRILINSLIMWLTW